MHTQGDHAVDQEACEGACMQAGGREVGHVEGEEGGWGGVGWGG